MSNGGTCTPTIVTARVTASPSWMLGKYNCYAILLNLTLLPSLMILLLPTLLLILLLMLLMLLLLLMVPALLLMLMLSSLAAAAPAQAAFTVGAPACELTRISLTHHIGF